MHNIFQLTLNSYRDLTDFNGHKLRPRLWKLLFYVQLFHLLEKLQSFYIAGILYMYQAALEPQYDQLNMLSL